MFGNHIVGFPTGRLIFLIRLQVVKAALKTNDLNLITNKQGDMKIKQIPAFHYVIRMISFFVLYMYLTGDSQRYLGDVNSFKPCVPFMGHRQTE